MSNVNDEEQTVNPIQNLVHCDTIITRLAGCRYHAKMPPAPGAPVQLVREPTNAVDVNAIMVYGPDGQKIGYLFKELAAEYAAIIDLGCVRLAGRLAAPGDLDFDADRLNSNPVIFIYVYVDPVRLAEICPEPGATSQPPGGLVGSTATTNH